MILSNNLYYNDLNSLFDGCVKMAYNSKIIVSALSLKCFNLKNNVISTPFCSLIIVTTQYLQLPP